MISHFESAEPPTAGTATAPAFGALPSNEAVGVVAPISSGGAVALTQPTAPPSVRCMRRNATTLAVAAASVIQLTSVTVALKGYAMRSVYEEKLARASENARRIRQGTDRIVSASKFGIVAKALWPFKTAAQIAAIAGRDERTAARWLSGEFEPPGIVYAAILQEITRRE